MLILNRILLPVLLRQQQQPGSNVALNNNNKTTTGGSLEHEQEKRADSEADKNNRHFTCTVSYGPVMRKEQKIYFKILKKYLGTCRNEPAKNESMH
jgi:hypothetical protein